MKHVEHQLGDLYGPLTFLVLEGKRVFEDLVEDFGEDWLNGKRGLGKAEVERWLYWTEEYFIPRNQHIQELLSNHSHLIEGDQIPISFLDFVDHHASWTLEIKRMREMGVAERIFSRRTWPEGFSKEVIATFELLKDRHERFIGAETPKLPEEESSADSKFRGSDRRPLRY